MASIRMVLSIGLSIGRVMWKKVCSPLDPSIMADSYTSPGTLERPDMK